MFALVHTSSSAARSVPSVERHPLSRTARARRGGADRVVRAEATPIGADDFAARAEIPTRCFTAGAPFTSRVPISPLAVNLDISPPVISGAAASRVAQRARVMGKGNLAPKNPPPGTVSPPPPTMPPPRHLMHNAVDSAVAATPPAPPPKLGEKAQKKTEGQNKKQEKNDSAPFRAPTTFFSHELYYNEPKKIDASKLRVAAEITYGRRGRMTMSRARDVAIAGSALRSGRAVRSETSLSDEMSTPGPEGARSTRSAGAGDSRAALRAKNVANANAVNGAALAQTTNGDGGGGGMYTHKRRVMRALDVAREELPDGSVMFRFSEKPLTAKEERALISEEESEAAEIELLHNHADEYQPQISAATANVVSRWLMTVQFLASTLSLESAAFYVFSTPFRTGFWTVAYTMRLVWWLCSGRMLPGRAGKRAKGVRGGGGGGRGGAFAAIDVHGTKMESKQSRAGRVSSGTINGRDVRNVLLS